MRSISYYDTISCMENDKNILLRKVPDRLSNIVKGLLLILISLPFVLIIWLAIGFSGGGYLSDVPGTDYGPLANMVAGGIFIIFLTVAILTMARPVTTKTKRRVFIFVFVILLAGIMFSVTH